MKTFDTLKAITRDAREIIAAWGELAKTRRDVDMMVVYYAREAIKLARRSDLGRLHRVNRARVHVETAIESAWDLRLPGCGRPESMSGNWGGN